jgi:hypothetical protein
MFLTEPSLSSLSSWVASFTNHKDVDKHIKNTLDTKSAKDGNNKRINTSSDQSTVNTPTTYTPLTLFFPLSATSMIIPPLSIDTQKVKFTYIYIHVYVFMYTYLCIHVYTHEYINLYIKCSFNDHPSPTNLHIEYTCKCFY